MKEEEKTTEDHLRETIKALREENKFLTEQLNRSRKYEKNLWKEVHRLRDKEASGPSV